MNIQIDGKTVATAMARSPNGRCAADRFSPRCRYDHSVKLCPRGTSHVMAIGLWLWICPDTADQTARLDNIDEMAD